MKTILCFLFFVAVLHFVSCKVEPTARPNTKVKIDSILFAKGADISWVPQMEASGYRFYNKDGILEDIMKILKDNGINTIRLRTWVDPSTNKTSGHCSSEEMVKMALRAKKCNMQLMIDFHYSDTWADPGHQEKPNAWKNLNFNDLKLTLYNYTFDVMSNLKAVGVVPEWVQVGNEISGGMLWPEGSTNNWPQLTMLINAGYDAIKKVNPNTQIILHIDQGNNNGRFRYWFDNALKYGIKYDVIGMSYYPYWLKGSPDYMASISDLGINLKDMAARYNKQVMVVEVGGEDSTPQNTYNMLREVIQKVKNVSDNNGLGVIYWEPQGARSWSGYSLSCWGDDGRPTLAIEAFN